MPTTESAPEAAPSRRAVMHLMEGGRPQGVCRCAIAGVPGPGQPARHGLLRSARPPSSLSDNMTLWLDEGAATASSMPALLSRRKWDLFVGGPGVRGPILQRRGAVSAADYGGHEPYAITFRPAYSLRARKGEGAARRGPGGHVNL